MNDFVVKWISSFFKAQGFKKSGLTWNRSVGDFIQVINFQFSKYSDSDLAKFTINLGVYDPIVWKVCWGDNRSGCIREINCVFRIRIGQILGESSSLKERWWDFKRNEDNPELAKELLNILTDKCLPFLNSIQSRSDILNLYANQKTHISPLEKIYIAILHLILGNANHYDHILNELSLNDPAWLSRTDEVRANRKLILELNHE